MKLYLSSFRLGEKEDRLRGMVTSTRVALVPNALDYVDDASARDSVVSRGTEDLRRVGINSDIIDLREFFADPENLRERLSDYNALFVTGGNVFVLRRAMRQSGLDQYIWGKNNDDGFLYAGYSAGVCVCGPSLRGFDRVDDPHIVPGARDAARAT